MTDVKNFDFVTLKRWIIIITELKVSLQFFLYFHFSTLTGAVSSSISFSEVQTYSQTFFLVAISAPIEHCTLLPLSLCLSSPRVLESAWSELFPLSHSLILHCLSPRSRSLFLLHSTLILLRCSVCFIGNLWADKNWRTLPVLLPLFVCSAVH